ncbi:MAG: hypothetical protein ACJ73E_02200 [Mycobacteriales bacterium]
MAYQDPVPGSPDDGSSTTDVAKEQAGRVGQAATQAGGQVAQTTKEQAQNVVGEARQQARDLAGEARGQLRDQAGTQRDRAVQGLRSLSDELDQMAYQGGQSGIATEVARQLSTRTRDLAGHLERHEPSDLVEQVRAYARRRPVVFLTGAALAGVVAGRLTRSLAAGAPHDGTRALGTGYPPVEPLTAGAAPYAADYPSAGYQTGAGYETGAGYQTDAGYQTGTGYQTPAYGTGVGAGSAYPTDTGTAGYPASEPIPEEYGATPGGYGDPEAGPDGAYGSGQPSAYPPPATGPDYPPPYEQVPEDEQPPARGWTP